MANVPMWTELEQQFVEAAGRALHKHRWLSPHEPGCVCARCRDGKEDSATLRYVVERAPVSALDSFLAAKLLGMLVQVNGGVGLGEIVRAAYDADLFPIKATPDANCLTTGDGHCVGTTLPCIHWPKQFPTHYLSALYLSAFASSIALESIGAGPKWTDEHAAFTVPVSGKFALEFDPDSDPPEGYAGAYVTIRPATRPFVVPCLGGADV